MAMANAPADTYKEADSVNKPSSSVAKARASLPAINSEWLRYIKDDFVDKADEEEIEADEENIDNRNCSQAMAPAPLEYLIYNIKNKPSTTLMVVTVNVLPFILFIALLVIIAVQFYYIN